MKYSCSTLKFQILFLVPLTQSNVPSLFCLLINNHRAWCGCHISLTHDAGLFLINDRAGRHCDSLLLLTKSSDRRIFFCPEITPFSLQYKRGRSQPKSSGGCLGCHERPLPASQEVSERPELSGVGGWGGGVGGE